MWARWRWRGLTKRLATIQLVLLDVDGVLTDGSLFYGPEGELSKCFNVRDGLGIRLLQNAGIEVAFLSGGRGGATEVRAQHLGIRHCLVGAMDKPHALTELCQRVGVGPEQIVYVGDDLNDLALRGRVGLLIAPADAVPALRRRADAVLIRKGGHGAVRELAERLLKSRGEWEQLCRQGWRDRND
ncbi:HAD family hydrolase [Synechococcus sp. LTW-R]|uniref:KdsC family phosphatase n=1 Tax=Synechococcus sp. LTW-R TaxID=2751170 RepID=UPI001624D8D5|nr:HAD-IIIA family hydrolase [Synechococcus sp. LTW-R]QNG29101.1 HAD-IIIA family hydrolase [Synechococcus sp. LTW-R]